MIIAKFFKYQVRHFHNFCGFNNNKLITMMWRKKLKILISYFLLLQKFACITKNALNIILCKSIMLFHNFLTTNHLYEFLMELNFDCFK